MFCNSNITFLDKNSQVLLSLDYVETHHFTEGVILLAQCKCTHMLFITDEYFKFSFLYRKKAFKKKHNKIHLNLSIALLLGLITFVSGIETATENKVNLSVSA